jgi:hypothetical protein
MSRVLLTLLCCVQCSDANVNAVGTDTVPIPSWDTKLEIAAKQDQSERFAEHTKYIEFSNAYGDDVDKKSTMSLLQVLDHGREFGANNPWLVGAMTFGAAGVALVMYASIHNNAVYYKAIPV